jgi:hypothetical protein
MSEVSRRRLLAGGVGLGAALALGGCESVRERDSESGAEDASPASSSETTAADGAVDDGSWKDTGAQPHQPTPEKLQPGQTPPQFVVISWDGAGESSKLPLLSHFRSLASELSASMTLFLSGIYFVPNAKRTLYQPPGRPAGSSAIPFFGPDSVHATIDNIGKAWLEGHEIGTHFNGHFCGSGGVGSWTVDQWKDEIAQAVSLVTSWRTNTGFTDLDPLPFDYRKELIGGRTPCLEGSTNLRTAADQLGWRYDSSSTGTQMWPKKVGRLWALDLQSIPFVGHDGSVISMDYNMMYNQSKTPDGDASQRETWRQQAVDSYLAGFTRAYNGNRAPLFIGNHFENWNGGIYMTAVEQVMRKIATYPDVRMVSFRQLCDYLDAQDPAVLTTLRALPTGSRPAGGWKALVKA